MFIAMNRFKINLGFEEGFEKIWRERESHLEEVPGYQLPQKSWPQIIFKKLRM